jgi:hypothetical protein
MLIRPLHVQPGVWLDRIAIPFDEIASGDAWECQP